MRQNEVFLSLGPLALAGPAIVGFDLSLLFLQSLLEFAFAFQFTAEARQQRGRNSQGQPIEDVIGAEGPRPELRVLRKGARFSAVTAVGQQLDDGVLHRRRRGGNGQSGHFSHFPITPRHSLISFSRCRL